MSADYHHNSAAYHPLQRLVIITKHYSTVAITKHTYDLIDALRALLLLFFSSRDESFVTRLVIKCYSVKNRELELRPSASAAGPSFGQWPREREKQGHWPANPAL